MAILKRLGILALLLAAACSDADGGSFSDDESGAGADDDSEGDGDEGDSDEADDDTPSDDEDDTDDDGDDEEADAGQRDAGRSDASMQAGDAGRDGGSRADAGPGTDSATPTQDAAADSGSAPTNDASGPVASGEDVPAGEHCAEAAAWDMQHAMFEQRVLELTNEARAKGHNCDTKGMFGPAAPLSMQPHLRCAARLHSKYMADNREFAHDQAMTGLDPFERMRATGYPNSPYGENIAWGQRTPEEVVNGWLESDGHCANMMSPTSTEIGIGYALGLSPSSGGGGGSRQAPYWTQNFGLMRRGR